MKSSKLQFKILNFKLLFYILIFTLFIADIAYAATFAVEVEAGKESINAVEGVVRFPDSVNISRIETGNSAILIWVEGPNYDREANIVRFSGISPGGFQGRQTLFSITGEFGAGDLDGIAFSEVRALKNDGEGSPVPVSLSVRSASPALDDAPPEAFKPVIGRSPDLFDGKHFASFLAHDKGQGIARYEYASSWIFAPGQDDWKPAVSPLQISGKVLFKKLYIRAIDQSGNYRVSTVSGPYHYVSLALGIIIILCLVMFTGRLFWRRLQS